MVSPLESKKELSGNSYLISTVKLALLHVLTAVQMIILGEHER